MKKLVVINAPFNLGLKQLSSRQPGVNQLPSWLQQHGLYKSIHPDKVTTVPAPAYGTEVDPESGIRNADQIISYSKELSAVVQAAVTAGNFPLVIGGDCSILIGCAHALKRHGRYALFFMDGHTDYVTTEFSATKAAAGMDLAIVTGNGHDKLADIDGGKPYFEEQHVIAFGNRYYDDAYVAQIKSSAIVYYDLRAIRQHGITQVIADLKTILSTNKLDGFWIHLDVDILNDALMPCVDSRQPDGLQYGELATVLNCLLDTGMAAGLNITILDPDLDPGGRFATAFIKELSVVLNSH